jgi:hypothetical protein
MARRPIDSAMSRQGGVKARIRTLWANEVAAATGGSYLADDLTREPWYLTLPGAYGHDIEALMDAGLVGRTENNGIPTEDEWKVVAVEKHLPAVGDLLNRIPGLNVRDVPINSLLKGEGLGAWPKNEEKRYCRARVVNLDFDVSLHAKVTSSSSTFPVIDWITKFGHIHREHPPVDWTLCLTLNADLDAANAASRFIAETIHDNAATHSDFAETCNTLLGDEVVSNMATAASFSTATLTRVQCQYILMLLIPKLIAKEMTNQGWTVTVSLNGHYGIADGGAAMVTWIMRFKWQSGGSAQSQSAYRTAVESIVNTIRKEALNPDHLVHAAPTVEQTPR